MRRRIIAMILIGALCATAARRPSRPKDTNHRRARDYLRQHGAVHGEPGGQASDTWAGAGESGLRDVSSVDDDRDGGERSTGEAGHDDDHTLLEAVLLDGDGPSDGTGS